MKGSGYLKAAARLKSLAGKTDATKEEVDAAAEAVKAEGEALLANLLEQRARLGNEECAGEQPAAPEISFQQAVQYVANVFAALDQAGQPGGGDRRLVFDALLKKLQS